MFEECKDIAELNRARIQAITEGYPPIMVNKAFAKRKATMLSAQDRGFKRVAFVPVPVQEQPWVDGVSYASLVEDNPYVIVVNTKEM